MIVQAPHPIVSGWLIDWMRENYGRSPRYLLASQLRKLRDVYGRVEAKRYSQAVRELGVYPKRVSGTDKLVGLMLKARERRSFYAEKGWVVSDVSIDVNHANGREALIACSSGAYRYWVNERNGISSQSLGCPSKLAEFISTDIESDRVSTNA